MQKIERNSYWKVDNNSKSWESLNEMSRASNESDNT